MLMRSPALRSLRGATWPAAIALAAAAPIAAQTPDTQRRPHTATEGSSQAQRISVDELQAHPSKYRGKQVTVEAEVQDVLGPRLLSIDSREVLELDGDLLVYLPAPFAGLVSERARVTATGTLQPLIKADIDRELQWIDENTASLGTVAIEKQSVLVATSIKSDRGVELAMRMEPSPGSASSSGAGDGAPRGTAGTPTGTTGTGTGTTTAPAAPITDLASIAAATDRRMVGRRVSLSNARVARAADQQSFWITGAPGRDELLVVPADPSAVTVSEGQSLTVEGVVLQMPRAWQDKFSTTQGTDEEIYVFASKVQAGSR
jgi:hypothetical protein